MTDRAAELRALAERCERADGPMFVMDCAIAAVLGYCYPAPPAYTASVDAALMLVRDNWLGSVRELWDDGKKAGYATVNVYERMVHLNEFCGVAATPALALCAASLKALAEQEQAA